MGYRHRRPASWKDYTETVLTFREMASACFRKLHRGWAGLLSESPPKPTTFRQLPWAEIDRLLALSKQLPMFPQSAVDEWGFVSEETQDERSGISNHQTLRQRWLRRFKAWQRAFANFESGVTALGSQIVPITVMYAAEQKGPTSSQEENRTFQQFLGNFADAWGALRTMQYEFRRRFGGVCSGGRLETLEAHERSNFQHLWAVAFGMRYERQRHLSDIGRIIETEAVRRRSQFLHSVGHEVSTEVGGSATVSVRETPWVLDGIPHLCITLDYRSLEPIEDTAPRVVEAVWRAAQAGGWRDLEWKPLEIEWPKIAIVTLVRSKALAPAFASLSTATVFSFCDAFEVKAHHHWALPVKHEDFERGGFRVWESPLLRAVIALETSVLAFVSANMRFHSLAKLVSEQRLECGETERIQSRFAVEMRGVLTEAQQSYSHLMGVLRTTSKPVAQRWSTELRGLCQALLFEVDGDVSISIDLESFGTWAAQLETKISAFRSVVRDIVSYALQGDGATGTSGQCEVAVVEP